MGDIVNVKAGAAGGVRHGAHSATPSAAASIAAVVHATAGNRDRESAAAGEALAPVAIHSSSTFRSRALCHRFSGSFSRHRRRVRSNAGGATSATEGARLSRIAPITLAGDDPSNARLPVSISYSTSPNEKMSEAVPASFPCNCSGDM